MGNQLNDIQLKVSKLLTEKKISIPKLALQLQMTKQNLYQILKSNDIHVSTLEKIAKILNVPMSHFFPEEQPKKVEKSENGKFIIQIEFDENKNLKMNFGNDFGDYIKK